MLIKRLVLIKKTGEYIFMNVQLKVLRDAKVFGTTIKRWSQRKNITGKIAILAAIANFSQYLLK
jgi:hypothetical protein